MESETTTFETDCKKGVRACNRPECPVCNPPTQTTLETIGEEAGEIFHQIEQAIITGIQCVQFSTEYKIGNPAYEQCCAELKKALARIK